MDDQSSPGDRGPYLPKPKVAERYRTTSRTVDRWRDDPELGFPAPLDINGFKYWSIPELIEWERLRAARGASPQPARGIALQRRERTAAKAAVGGAQ
jgi:hypothetical protein